MNIELIEYIKGFLTKNDLDGIIINSTNEFLVEYNMLEFNSRYHLTGFSGSVGDVLFTADKIYQFVDPRYHEQADNEVDKDFVNVIKVPLGQSSISAIIQNIPVYFRLGLVAKKTPKRIYDLLMEKLKEKNSTVKLLNTDPVEEFTHINNSKINYNVFDVDSYITGATSDEKFLTIKESVGEEKFTIIVTTLEDIAYITNKRSYDFECSATFPAKSIITEEGVKVFSNCELSFIGNYFKVEPLNEFENEIRKLDNKKIFIDNSSLSIYDYNLINKSNTILPSHLNLFKTVKNEKEIEHMKKCFKRADEALKVIYQMINSDEIYSEYDYAQALKKAMKENGALSLSFHPIVAAGSNTSIIHYKDSSKEKLVQDGDFLLVDYGGYYEGGIATDTTRTFLKGTPTPEQKTAYTAVLKAFLSTYTTKYNKKSSYFDIDKIARDTINNYAPEGCIFSHATGHGVGISVHENPPVVSQNNISKTKILENSTFSIEPGLYKEGWGGIRLENTVYASYTEDGVQLNTFSHFPFETKLTDLSIMTDAEKYYYMKWQAASCIQ
ncbi:M24 family metallopeptidase [bacterium]|nr:M24 family metallopeptidase [bacterium]